MKPKIATHLFLAALAFACARVDTAEGPATETAPAPVQHSMDRASMWKTTLDKTPVAATAAFDQKGRLWRVSVVDAGYVAVSHSDDKSRSFSKAVRVNRAFEQVAAEGENRPKIAVATNGTIYVAYTQSLEQPFAGRIRFSRSVDGGTRFSAPMTVNTDREITSHRFDALGVNARGQVYVAWLDKRDLLTAKRKGEKYSGVALYYVISNDAGTSFTPNVKLLDHLCECCRIGMAMDVDDTPVIAWRHVFENSVRDHALVRLDGKAKPSRFSHENWQIEACPHHGPAVSIAGDGIYHLVWFSGATHHPGLFYTRSDDQGKSFRVPIGFGNEEAQPSHPHVLSMGRQVFVTWKEFDGEYSIIRLMRSNDGNGSWSVPQTLASTKGASDHPALINDARNAFLSWHTIDEGYRLIELDEVTQL
ncbi:MAG: hypothetical protein ACREYE_11735 [Gammaproteobacteria bacterium]